VVLPRLAKRYKRKPSSKGRWRISSQNDKPINVKRRSIDDYKDDPRNANRGSERGSQMVEDSLNAVGPGRSLVADANDYLPAGNKTKAAAKRAGITEVIEVETDGDAIIVHKRRDWNLLSAEDKRARLYAYFDNQSSAVSLTWDVDVMAQDYADGLDMTMMFDPGELAFNIGNDLVYGAGSQSAAKEQAAEDAPDLGKELQAKWQTASGQLWRIPSKHKGIEHRVLCGDSRNADDVKRLFAGKKAQIAFTSPPYAMQRANIQTNNYGGIPEDEYVDWWNAVQANTRDVLVDGGSFFVNIKPHTSDGERSLYVMDLVLAMKRQWGWQYIDEHIWKRNTVPGKFHRRLKNGFEPVHEFATTGDNFVFDPRRMGTKSESVMKRGQAAKNMTSTGTYFNVSTEVEAGIALPENIFEVSGVRQGIAHSAMYPVGLPYRFMMIYTDPKQIVYDPFLGSGTNIHAAEKARRASWGVELLPEHLGVLLEEWSLDGYEPELIES
jgi:site-specific DNA-methyltransferase (adenine-specific)